MEAAENSDIGSDFDYEEEEVDESNRTATIENVSNTFEKTQATPEKDAYFFSKVASEAATANMKSSTA